MGTSAVSVSGNLAMLGESNPPHVPTRDLANPIMFLAIFFAEEYCEYASSLAANLGRLSLCATGIRGRSYELHSIRSAMEHA